MRYGSCKDKKGAKYYDVPLFLAPLTFTRDSREIENYPRSQSGEDGRTGFYKFVSLRIRLNLDKHLRIKSSDKSLTQRFDVSMTSLSSGENKI